MKNFFTIFTICVVFAIVLSSCKSEIETPVNEGFEQDLIAFYNEFQGVMDMTRSGINGSDEAYIQDVIESVVARVGEIGQKYDLSTELSTFENYSEADDLFQWLNDSSTLEYQNFVNQLGNCSVNNIIGNKRLSRAEQLALVGAQMFSGDLLMTRNPGCVMAADNKFAMGLLACLWPFGRAGGVAMMLDAAADKIACSYM